MTILPFLEFFVEFRKFSIPYPWWLYGIQVLYVTEDTLPDICDPNEVGAHAHVLPWLTRNVFCGKVFEYLAWLEGLGNVRDL